MASWLESRENKHKPTFHLKYWHELLHHERNTMAAEDGKLVVIFLDTAASALGQEPFLILES